MSIQPLDPEQLRQQFRTASPFPHVCLDGFLEEDFARQVAQAFPSFEYAQRDGKTFVGVNEKGKVQVRDVSKFAPPVKKLHETLADPQFLSLLSFATDIPGLVADEQLIGGGIHETTRAGHLDVHVDFNVIKDRQLHRRLNIIVFVNQDWNDDWGGRLELWDSKVRNCVHSIQPLFNRCVIFATSGISYHGVTAVKCPPGNSRKSFAAYYYTQEAPAGWDGTTHTTLFKARPNEVMKGKLLMPVERIGNAMRKKVHGFTRRFSK